jgi:hypothetical protein
MRGATRLATCWKCGRDVPLRRDGTLRRHYLPDPPWRHLKLATCPGSLTKPAP